VAVTSAALLAFAAAAALHGRRGADTDPPPGGPPAAPAAVPAGRAQGVTVRDDPIPPPRGDPTFQGVAASAWATLLKDADPATRTQAAKALFTLGDGAVAHVEPVYRRGGPQDRAAAATVLAQLLGEARSEEALAAVLRAARCSDPVARSTALDQLAEHGAWSPRAREAVERGAKDSNPRVAEKAREVLAKMKGPRGGP
jgi:hypothetical protein